MKFSLAIAMLSTASAFNLAARMQATGSKLTLTGNNVEITDPLRNYADSKLGKSLDRYERMLTSVSVHLRVEKRGGGLHDEAHQGLESHIAEITALCRDKQVIRVCEETENMYASLDQLTDTFTRKMRKHKERKMQRQRGTGSAAENMSAEDDEDEDEEELVPPAA